MEQFIMPQVKPVAVGLFWVNRYARVCTRNADLLYSVRSAGQGPEVPVCKQQRNFLYCEFISVQMSQNWFTRFAIC